MEETPKERTERLHEELNRKIAEHERLRQANQGKNQFSASHKIKVALPLFILAAGLYIGSFKHVKERIRMSLDNTNSNGFTKTDDDINIVTLDYRENHDMERDDEFINDDNKRW